MSVRDKLYSELKADFPEEAYSADKSRGHVLTSLKAQYISERLTEVFGLGNWKLSGEWKEVDDGVLYLGKLECSFIDDDGEKVTITTEIVPGFGGENHRNSGDAYKSARTDCLSKSSSYLGVGNDMYKGKIEPPLSNEQREFLESKEESEEEAPKKKSTTKKAKTTTFKKAAKKEEPEEAVDAGSLDDDDEEEAVKPKTVAKLKSTRMFTRPKGKFTKKGDK